MTPPQPTGDIDQPPQAAATTTESAAAGYQPLRAPELVALWSRLIIRLSGALRAPEAASFAATIADIDGTLLSLAENDADRAIFVATFLAESESTRYCAAHSLDVALSCHLASRAMHGWDEQRRAQLRRAALTMNIAMAVLQDQMARQSEEPTSEQRGQIDKHAERGADLLRELGIDDGDWLEAVAQHHLVGPGALGSRSPGVEIARLIQRADRLTASHSIRLRRPSRGAGDASLAAYLDESKQPDQAGAALVKALGIYPPGSLVRLANREVAIVMCRGVRADQPQVAAVVREDGMPYLRLVLRDTALPRTKIVASLAQSAINVRLSLEAVLKLMPRARERRGAAAVAGPA